MPLTDQQRGKLSRALRRIAKRLDKEIERETGHRMGFSLIIWGQFGEDKMTQYVANADRADCAKYMQDLLDRWRTGMPDLPFHERQ